MKFWCQRCGHISKGEKGSNICQNCKIIQINIMKDEQAKKIKESNKVEAKE